MSRDDDRHLSDVHLLAEADDGSDGEAPCHSSFAYGPNTEHDGESPRTAPAEIDEDGDACIQRRLPNSTGGQINVHHALSTALGDVGLQVWRGALVLADHLLSAALAEQLRGATVLDLGAGCGLTSIVAATAGARLVFCTDVHRPSLLNAARNAAVNRVGRAVRVRRLDWSDGDGADQRRALLGFGRWVEERSDCSGEVGTPVVADGLNEENSARGAMETDANATARWPEA